MNKKNLNIIQDFLKKKLFIKIELKKKLLKNIIFNKNIKPEIRMVSKLKLQKINKKKKTISNQNNNICLKTGKIKSVLNITNLSRHYVKKISIENNLQNFRVNNW